MIPFAWRDVVFQHYRIVDEDAFARRLPRGTELDRWAGHAYASVVSVWNERPWRFAQVNVRTYVRGGAVVFLGNAVASRLFAWGGWLAGVPQHHARVRHHRDGAAITYVAGGHRIAGRLGAPTDHGRGTLASFLVDRLLQVGQIGISLITRVEHAPWPLHFFDVDARSDAAIEAAGLRPAVVPIEVVHASPGVDANMSAPVPARSRAVRAHLSPA